MIKLLMILPMVLILCLVVGCQDKEAMAELEAMKAQAEVEEFSVISITRFVDGKVVEMWAEFDSLDLYQQLGRELKPMEGEK